MGTDRSARTRWRWVLTVAAVLLLGAVVLLTLELTGDPGDELDAGTDDALPVETDADPDE